MPEAFAPAWAQRLVPFSRVEMEAVGKVCKVEVCVLLVLQERPFRSVYLCAESVIPPHFFETTPFAFFDLRGGRVLVRRAATSPLLGEIVHLFP